MILTLTGICCIIFIFFLFLKEKREAVLDPRLYILISYFGFWGKLHDMEINWGNDILLFCSFLIFYSIVSFMYNKDLASSRKFISWLPLDETSKVLKRKLSGGIVFLIYLFGASYLVINVMYYAAIYDSYELFLVRFYSRLPVFETVAIYGTLLSYMSLLSSLGLCLIRYSNVRFSKKDSFLFCILLYGNILLAFSSGTRGRVLIPAVLIFFSDFFAMIKMKQSFFKRLFRFANIILIVIELCLFLFLTEHRGTYYNSVDEVVSDLFTAEYLFSINSSDSGLSFEKDLMMRDYYLTLDLFPKQVEYLPLLSTFYTIAVNPIPRFLWLDKPAGFGRRLAALKANKDHTDNAYISLEIPASFAVGIHGEGYANGGIFGILFYSVILGIVSGFFANLYKNIYRYDSFLSFVLCIILLRVPSCCIRGDILSGITQQIFPVIGIFIVLIFSKSFLKKGFEKQMNAEIIES